MAYSECLEMELEQVAVIIIYSYFGGFGAIFAQCTRTHTHFSKVYRIIQISGLITAM